MKTSIFIRILLAALLPLLVVMILVVTTINIIVYRSGADFAREAAAMAAKRYSDSLSEKIASSDRLLLTVSGSLSNPDFNSSQAYYGPRATISSILNSDPDIYSAWFVFEPGLYPDGRAYSQTLIREGGHLVEAPGFASNELLSDPRALPWYREMLRNGSPYMNLVSDDDFRPGRGVEAIAEGAYPLWSDGRVVGCIGIGFKLEDFFNAGDLRFVERLEFKLVSESGLILSSGADEKRLFEPADGETPLAAALKAEGNYFAEIDSPLSGLKSFVGLLPLEFQLGRERIFLYLDVPLSELYARAELNMELIYLTAFIGVILLIVSVFAATRNIVRPIRALTADFRKISGGDLDLPSHIENDENISKVAELDILQRSLWKMLEQVNLNHELRFKAAEEQVEKEKIIAASEAKTNFFANMSHEIRTPMNAVLGISEILLHEGGLSAKQRRCIEDIKGSSESLLTIINDILDLSKLESGKLDLRPQDYGFPAFLAGIRSIASYLAENNGLLFVYEESGDIPQCLWGDDVRLRQVLLNLISNAVKFTAQGEVRLGVNMEAASVSFKVSDSGMGIRPEDIDGIFEPFQQTDIMRNRKIRGAGLGLSISRSLVEMMNGKLSVTSEYGRGSTFTVSVPKILGNPERLNCEEDDRFYIYDSKVKVMVVDDNAVNLTVAAGLLKTIFGLQADQASSGREAIEKAQKISYDLIFMDHMMPDMDGIETTRRIRRLKPDYASLPIVALTANAVQGAREMLLASGIDDFLSKPIVKKDIAAILYKWLPAKYRKAPLSEACRPDFASVGAGPGHSRSDSPAAVGLRLQWPSQFIQAGGADGKAADGRGLPANQPGGPGGVSAGGRSLGSPTPFLAQALWPVEVLREIDMAAGLGLVAGQQEIYEEMLSLSAADFPRQALNVEQFLADGNWEALAIEVHGLKSSLASLGAGDLSGLARELEKAARERDESFCRSSGPVFSERLASLGLDLSRTINASGIKPDFEENPGPADALSRPAPPSADSPGFGGEYGGPKGVNTASPGNGPGGEALPELRSPGAAGLRPDFSPASSDDLLRKLGRALSVYDYGAIMDNLSDDALEAAQGRTRELLKEVRKKMRRFDYEGASEILRDSVSL